MSGAIRSAATSVAAKKTEDRPDVDEMREQRIKEKEERIKNRPTRGKRRPLLDVEPQKFGSNVV